MVSSLIILGSMLCNRHEARGSHPLYPQAERHEDGMAEQVIELCRSANDRGLDTVNVII